MIQGKRKMGKVIERMLLGLWLGTDIIVPESPRIEQGVILPSRAAGYHREGESREAQGTYRYRVESDEPHLVRNCGGKKGIAF